MFERGPTPGIDRSIGYKIGMTDGYGFALEANTKNKYNVVMAIGARVTLRNLQKLVKE